MFIKLKNKIIKISLKRTETGFYNELYIESKDGGWVIGDKIYTDEIKMIQDLINYISSKTQKKSNKYKVELIKK